MIQNPDRHFDSNQQYSITALTDGGGSVVERYAYTAYGQVTFADASGTVQTAFASNNRYTYTGREWDQGLSLYHYRARMYDAVAGRFVSRDPIGYEDGSNTYSAYFVPFGTDPTGLEISVGITDSAPLPDDKGGIFNLIPFASAFMNFSMNVDMSQMPCDCEFFGIRQYASYKTWYEGPFGGIYVNEVGPFLDGGQIYPNAGPKDPTSRDPKPKGVQPNRCPCGTKDPTPQQKWVTFDIRDQPGAPKQRLGRRLRRIEYSFTTCVACYSKEIYRSDLATWRYYDHKYDLGCTSWSVTIWKQANGTYGVNIVEPPRGPVF